MQLEQVPPELGREGSCSRMEKLSEEPMAWGLMSPDNVSKRVPGVDLAEVVMLKRTKELKEMGAAF